MGPTGLHKVDSGASTAQGSTKSLAVLALLANKLKSWTNVDQNHVYFVQDLYGKCTIRYLTQTKIVYGRHKTASLVYKGLNDVF